MNKKQIINKIKEIIKEYGSFYSGELEGYDSSIAHNSMGNIVSLIEEFNQNDVTVEVYNTRSFSSDSISDYTVPYNELTLITLKHILDFAKQYKKQQIEENL